MYSGGYGWFSWGVASLPESKSESLPLVLKDKRSCFSQGSLYSCLLTACLPSGSGMLNWHLETIYTKVIWLSCTMTINGSKHCHTPTYVATPLCLVPNPSILSPFVHFYTKAEWTQIRALQTREGRMEWDRISPGLWQYYSMKRLLFRNLQKLELNPCDIEVHLKQDDADCYHQKWCYYC